MDPEFNNETCDFAAMGDLIDWAAVPVFDSETSTLPSTQPETPQVLATDMAQPFAPMVPWDFQQGHHEIAPFQTADPRFNCTNEDIKTLISNLDRKMDKLQASITSNSDANQLGFSFNPEAEPFQPEFTEQSHLHWDTKELKVLIERLHSKVDELEAVVTVSNDHLKKLTFNVEVLMPQLCNMPSEIQSSIDGLKKGMKTFTQGFIKHLLTGDIEAKPSYHGD